MRRSNSNSYQWQLIQPPRQWGPDAQPVSGVGDLAYYSKQKTSIGVLAHGVMFIIGALNSGQPVSKDVLIAAAQRAATRL